MIEQRNMGGAYAALDDIPIERGRAEWSCAGIPHDYYIVGLTTATSGIAYRDSPEYAWGATVGQVIHDACNALCGPESDEAWLSKRGVSESWKQWDYREVGYVHCARLHARGKSVAVFERPTEAAAYAALRRAVEALESGE